MPVLADNCEKCSIRNPFDCFLSGLLSPEYGATSNGELISISATMLLTPHEREQENAWILNVVAGFPEAFRFGPMRKCLKERYLHRLTSQKSIDVFKILTGDLPADSVSDAARQLYQEVLRRSSIDQGRMRMIRSRGNQSSQCAKTK